MKRAERERMLRQGVVKPETPRDRLQRAGLEADLEGSPLVGKRLPLRLRNFRPSAEGYLASLGGPLPYMLRLREIEERTAAHERALEEAWRRVAAECEGDPRSFAERWRAVAEHWSFFEVNDLIARHNRWYPAESRLPMDPRRGDYALVNGKDYRRRPLDAAWALARFPAELESARAAQDGSRTTGRRSHDEHTTDRVARGMGGFASATAREGEGIDPRPRRAGRGTSADAVVGR